MDDSALNISGAGVEAVGLGLDMDPLPAATMGAGDASRELAELEELEKELQQVRSEKELLLLERYSACCSDAFLLSVVFHICALQQGDIIARA